MESIAKMKNHYFDAICDRCPAADFGRSTVCSYHGKHIGFVDKCEAWEGEPQLIIQSEKYSDMPGILSEWLGEYEMFPHIVGELEKRKAENRQTYITPKYGIEAGLPTGNKTSDQTFQAAARVLQIDERIERIKGKRKIVDVLLSRIRSEFELELANSLVTGTPTSVIAEQWKCSQRQIQAERSRVMKEMANRLMTDYLLLELYDKVTFKSPEM